MTQILHVENIKCWWCINSIKTALNKQPGVTSIEINKDKQTITLWGDIDTDAIQSYLTNLGYPPAGTGNILNKAKSYVSCAIGTLSS